MGATYCSQAAAELSQARQHNFQQCSCTSVFVSESFPPNQHLFIDDLPPAAPCYALRYAELAKATMSRGLLEERKPPSHKYGCS